MFNFFFDEKDMKKLHVTKYMYGAYVKKDTILFVFLKRKKIWFHTNKKTSLYSVVNNKHET